APTILVLGALLDEEALAAVALGLEASVHTPGDLERLGRAARSVERRARVHVDVDTGLARHGAEPARALELVELVLETPGLVLAGLMTHFAQSSSAEAMAEALAQFEPI